MHRKIKPNKKVAPKVKNGKVQKKNNWDETPSYWNTRQKVPVIDKEAPGRGYKHYLKKKDILDFIEIVPEWDKLSQGLNAILLSRGDPTADGIHHCRYGVIEICAWERDGWIELTAEGYAGHKKLLKKLGVECEKRKNYYVCKFDEIQIKAYQLVHVFLHELGHHHDKMTTKSRRSSSRGESFAENYAKKYEDKILRAYFDKLGL